MHQTCASDSLKLPGPKHIKKVCLERHLTEGEVAEWTSRQQSVATTEEMESDTHWQRWSAWFLWKEGASTADIHRRLQGVRGDHAPGKRTVYDWVTAFKNGRQSADDRPGSGRPATAVTAVNIKRVKDAILENRRLSFTQLEAALGIGRRQLWTIVHKHLLLRKLCARWVPKHLTPQQRLRRVEDCTALLNMHDADSEAFFRGLVTGDESWLHCYDLIAVKGGYIKKGVA